MISADITAGRTGGWMQTQSGRPFWPMSPRPEDFDIVDIAHALSNLCRFGGHTNRFYSVAEHAVHVSYAVPPEHAWDALHHDDTEAYCVDVPRPLKLQLANYAEIEHGIWLAIAKRFDLSAELPACVHEADNAVLLAERDALLLPPPFPWTITGKPADVNVMGLAPQDAKDFYLSRHAQLLSERMRARRQ